MHNLGSICHEFQAKQKAIYRLELYHKYPITLAQKENKCSLFHIIFQLYLGLLDQSKYDGSKYSKVEDLVETVERPIKKWSSLKQL